MDTHPVAEKLVHVQERIRESARKSGRRPQEIRMIAVTKYATMQDGFIEALLAAHCGEFGEARPQSLLEKAGHFADSPIHWHLIGSLQRNKIRKILPICRMIHSVDSLRLLEAIDRIVADENFESVPDMLLEVNISGEESKHGFEPGELPEILEQIGTLQYVRIRGLMGMSGLLCEQEQKRREFRSLWELSQSLERYAPENVSLHELSMGMSDDFEIAVQEGATLLRIGSILYP